MYTPSILLESVSRDEFDNLIYKIDQLALLMPKPQIKDKYLTRHEVAKLLRISLPTLNELTKKGKLIGYRIGGRVLYKESEVESSLHQIVTSKYKR
jgi:excisionase family DNA binding protein